MALNKKQADVDVWTISLLEPRPLFLSNDEEIRASRFRSEKHRMHWSRAHSALRMILSQALGTPPLSIGFKKNSNGKPLVDDVHFNLSHTEDYAMIAICKAVPVGIDIERLRDGVDMAQLLERLGETDLPDNTHAQYQRWTDREAASKARGGALFDPADPQVKTVSLRAPENHFASLATVDFVPSPRYCSGVGSL